MAQGAHDTTRIRTFFRSPTTQAFPGKASVMLRLYSPLESWFDKTWRPGEIEEMNS
jgi:hypothetical protein